MRDVFKTIDIIADIDWHYFALSNLALTTELSAKEIRKLSLRHYISIIKNKRKLGYDVSKDIEAHGKIKAFKTL